VLRHEIPDDVTFIDLEATRVRHALPRVISLVRRIKPDILFSTLGHLNVALAMIRFLLPGSVRTVARETTVVSCSLDLQKHRLLWRALYQTFYRLHDEVICQSRYMRDDLVTQFQFPASKVCVIHNPVDVERVRRLAMEPAGIPTAPGTVNLVAAGRLDKEKGFDLLIDALALLNRPEIQLTLLGEGTLEDELKRHASERGVAGQIHFAGFQSNPFAWFAKADAFVLSSRYEGFPNVVLESLACGTPVIATPAPGGTGEILQTVADCVIASDVSAPALAEAIRRWMESPRRRIADSAVDPYRLERILAQYEAALLREMPA
jgi:glycosyltransferase involved in cell wall biosynthesis